MVISLDYSLSVIWFLVQITLRFTDLKFLLHQKTYKYNQSSKTTIRPIGSVIEANINTFLAKHAHLHVLELPSFDERRNNISLNLVLF